MQQKKEQKKQKDESACVRELFLLLFVSFPHF